MNESTKRVAVLNCLVNPSPKHFKQFWSKVVKSENCWGWAGCKHGGYGNIRINKTTLQSHRVSWVIHNGIIPDGLWVLHKCDNRECTNPNHLYLGTVIENSRDAVKRKRLAMGESHYASKITEKDVREIKKCALDGENQTSIAKAFNIGQDEVSRIINRKRWKHIV